jgi:hypothetical protein
MATPTDGLRVPNDLQRDLLGQNFMGKSGAVAPTAVQAAPAPVPAAAIAAPGFKL